MAFSGRRYSVGGSVTVLGPKNGHKVPYPDLFRSAVSICQELCFDAFGHNCSQILEMTDGDFAAVGVDDFVHK